MTEEVSTVPVTPTNELLTNLGLIKDEDNNAAITAAALYEDEKKKFTDAANIANDASAISLREPMNKILGEPGFAAQIPLANFKVHKVKPGNAKGVLGFKNTTVGDETYTQLVFKPFDSTGKAEIVQTELDPQPLLHLNGEGESSGAKERKMTSNMIANIADAAYSNISTPIESVKNEWYGKAQNAFKATDGRDVYGQSMKEARLVGGKSKKRRVQRRKSVRRRRMSNRKR